MVAEIEAFTYAPTDTNTVFRRNSYSPEIEM